MNNFEETGRASGTFEQGMEQLRLRGIDPQAYLQYFRLMQDNDCGFVGALNKLNAVERLGGLTSRPNCNRLEVLKLVTKHVDHCIAAWEIIERGYQRIDPSQFDENSGVAAITEIKVLVQSSVSYCLPGDAHLLSTPIIPFLCRLKFSK